MIVFSQCDIQRVLWSALSSFYNQIRISVTRSDDALYYAVDSYYVFCDDIMSLLGFICAVHYTIRGSRIDVYSLISE